MNNYQLPFKDQLKSRYVKSRGLTNAISDGGLDHIRYGVPIAVKLARDRYLYNKEVRKVNKELNKLTKADTKSFSSIGSALMSSAVSLAGLGWINPVIKAISNEIFNNLEGSTKRDIIQLRNNTLNQLHSNYKSSSDAGILTEKDVTLYKNKLTTLAYQSIAIGSKYHDDRATANESHIKPFLALLGIIVVKGVYLLPGIPVGYGKMDFEIVFDPRILSVQSLISSGIRNTIYKYPWPLHNFEIPYKLCKNDVHKFIQSTIDFLSHNIKYLCIRV